MVKYPKPIKPAAAGPNCNSANDIAGTAAIIEPIHYQVGLFEYKYESQCGQGI
jgi:hypothetical protein